jgi:FeS assembly SUF system regulator
MVRITKLTDYGMVIMAFMAGCPSRLLQAREIADQTAVAQPTVAKLLKKLTKNKLLASQRGTNGGYLLARAPEKITVADLVQALEGPIAITECSLGHDHCPTETLCTIRAPWLQINEVITNALQSIKLSDLVSEPFHPLNQATYPLQFVGGQHGHH